MSSDFDNSPVKAGDVDYVAQRIRDGFEELNEAINAASMATGWNQDDVAKEIFVQTIGLGSRDALPGPGEIEDVADFAISAAQIFAARLEANAKARGEAGLQEE